MSRLRSQSGFTLIEVMIGALLLGMGLIVVAGSFDHFRNLGNLSAKKNAATHVAQKEIERLRALGFDGLEMDASPGTSTNPNDPRYGVTGAALRRSTSRARRRQRRTSSSRPTRLPRT